MPGWEWKASRLVLHLMDISLTLLYYFMVSLVGEEGGVTAKARLRSYLQCRHGGLSAVLCSIIIVVSTVYCKA